MPDQHEPQQPGRTPAGHVPPPAHRPDAGEPATRDLSTGLPAGEPARPPAGEGPTTPLRPAPGATDEPPSATSVVTGADEHTTRLPLDPGRAAAVAPDLPGADEHTTRLTPVRGAVDDQTAVMSGHTGEHTTRLPPDPGRAAAAPDLSGADEHTTRLTPVRATVDGPTEVTSGGGPGERTTRFTPVRDHADEPTVDVGGAISAGSAATPPRGDGPSPARPARGAPAGLSVPGGTDGDEPTLVTPPRFGDQATTRLWAPPAADDEPTVERPMPALKPPSLDGGATQRLQPLRPPPADHDRNPSADAEATGPTATAPPGSAASTAPPPNTWPPVAGPSAGTAAATPAPTSGPPTRPSPPPEQAATPSRAAGPGAPPPPAPTLDSPALSSPAPSTAPEPAPSTAPDPAPSPAAAPSPTPTSEDRSRQADDPPDPDLITSPAVSPDPVTSGAPQAAAPETADPTPRRRLSGAGALIWVLLALFGFTLVVQLSSNNTDNGLAGARQEDLVRILSDLEARDTRLQAEIAALETSQRRLTSGVQGRQAALAEAEKRADELGLLAGTIAGRGPGLRIGLERVKASAVLNAVQELRGAGGEVMQLAGASGPAVRIVASSFFVDGDGGVIVVDGTSMTGPFTLSVIGVPGTMQTALQIPGGVVASVNGDGGSVTMEQRSLVEVTAVRRATSLRYARPVS